MSKPRPIFDAASLSQKLRERPRQRWEIEGFRESAVLLPLVLPSPDNEPSLHAEPEVLFIVRTASMPTHAGQVAFPGGKREVSDHSLDHTALRETQEELGILAEQVELLGQLDDMPTPMGFNITPVVGLVRGPLRLTPNQGEVADTFTVPLFELPRLYREAGKAEWKGHLYTMHEFSHPKYRIWGATAAMMLQLLFLLDLVPHPGRAPSALR
jgi:8-oxo-dGTP pyrophosphatase MutT (NUDIX family)